MRADLWTVAQWGVLLSAFASLAVAAPPVVRHAFGIVVIEQRAPSHPLRLNPDVRPLDLTAALELAPFGRAAAAPSEQIAASADGYPEMQLKGVFSAPDSKASSALIALADVQGFYRVGDPISAGLSLQTVALDHVIIAAPDGTLTLHFDQTETNLAARAPAVETDEINTRLRAAAVVADRNQRAGAPKTTEDYISYWRRKIQKNPQAVLETIGLEPSDEGYRIAQKHNRGVRLAGLQAGDVVRSVNGSAVGNPDEDRDAYDKIAASGQARLEVQRGDKILTFSFPLR